MTESAISRIHYDLCLLIQYIAKHYLQFKNIFVSYNYFNWNLYLRCFNLCFWCAGFLLIFPFGGNINKLLFV